MRGAPALSWEREDANSSIRYLEEARRRKFPLAGDGGERRPASKSCVHKHPAITSSSIRRVNRSWPNFPMDEASDAHAAEIGSALGTQTRKAMYGLYPMGKRKGREYRSAITNTRLRVEFGRVSKSAVSGVGKYPAKYEYEGPSSNDERRGKTP